MTGCSRHCADRAARAFRALGIAPRGAEHSRAVEALRHAPISGGVARIRREPAVEIASQPGGRAPLDPRDPRSRRLPNPLGRSEEHTSELQSLMRNSYAVFCLKKKNTTALKLRLIYDR